MVILMFEIFKSIINYIANYFAQFGGLVFICFMVIAYTLLLFIGVYLKSKSVFENKINRYLFGIAGALLGGIIGIILGGIAWALLGMILGGIAWALLELALIVIVGDRVGVVAWRIAWALLGGIIGGIVGGIAGAIMGIILMVIIGEITLMIIGRTVGVIGIVIVMTIVLAIAKYEYKKAIKYLLNRNIKKAYKSLRKALYLLKNYDSDTYPYINDDLAESIINMINNIEKNSYLNDNSEKSILEIISKVMLQKAEKDYNSDDDIWETSDNYHDFLEDEYNELIYDEVDLEEEYNELIKHEINRELEEIEHLIKNNKVEEALNNAKILLESFPDHKDKITPTIKRCEEILNNHRQES
jgi:ABC-type multidrug transport system fused ATPase/permease subunit